jgi:hypothetical protein
MGFRVSGIDQLFAGQDLAKGARPSEVKRAQPDPLHSAVTSRTDRSGRRERKLGRKWGCALRGRRAGHSRRLE